MGYPPNQQQFQSLDSAVGLSQPELSEPQSISNLGQSTFLPLGFQPFGYPQSKNFVYAYSQQANMTSSAISAMASLSVSLTTSTADVT